MSYVTLLIYVILTRLDDGLRNVEHAIIRSGNYQWLNGKSASLQVGLGYDTRRCGAVEPFCNARDKKQTLSLFHRCIPLKRSRQSRISHQCLQTFVSADTNL